MTKNNKIKNIIFDLGGVLIDLYEEKTINCFDGAKISAFYGEKLNPKFIKLAHDFETATISAVEFREGVCELFNLNISAKKFDECWNAMIGKMTENRHKLLLELRKKYRLFVLSNTNEIHYNFFTKQKYWKPELFEITYFSHLLKMRKPNTEIFNYVLAKNKLIAEETIFVDDNVENVKSASKTGISAYLVDKEIELILKDIL